MQSHVAATHAYSNPSPSASTLPTNASAFEAPSLRRPAHSRAALSCFRCYCCIVKAPQRARLAGFCTAQLMICLSDPSGQHNAGNYP